MIYTFEKQYAILRKSYLNPALQILTIFFVPAKMMILRQRVQNKLGSIPCRDPQARKHRESIVISPIVVLYYFEYMKILNVLVEIFISILLMHNLKFLLVVEYFQIEHDFGWYIYRSMILPEYNIYWTKVS